MLARDSRDRGRPEFIRIDRGFAFNPAIRCQRLPDEEFRERPIVRAPGFRRGLPAIATDIVIGRIQGGGMRRGSKGSGLFAFVVITALAAAPLLAGTGGGMTTADLALQMARAAGIQLPADEPAKAALESLGKAGIKLGTDLKAPVTEKVLLEVGLAVGAKVSTSRPEAAVTPAAGSAFVQMFKGAIQNAAAVSGQSGKKDEVHASCQGRESREARQGTPASQSSFNATAGPCEEPAS